MSKLSDLINEVWSDCDAEGDGPLKSQWNAMRVGALELEARLDAAEAIVARVRAVLDDTER
jgi:hypothetical protein